MFNAANLAVYDKGMENHGKSRMATTLAVVVLSNNEITVGNVGDSRVYLVRKATIKQLSTDHTYIGMQQKFGLISEQEAKTSDKRSVLTRSVGQEPMIRVDVETATVFKGDKVVLCSDGLYAHVADSEIAEIVTRLSPAQACRQLVALAEQRGTDDNLSVQVVQINEVEKVALYRGVAMYQETADPTTKYELKPGQVLDNRFQILETISKSGMATIFKATDLNTKLTVAIKVPLLQYESDPGFYSRFLREEEIGSRLNHPYYPEILSRSRGASHPAVHRDRVSPRVYAVASSDQRPADAGKGRDQARLARVRGARVHAWAGCRASGPETPEHHALQRRRDPDHGLRHCQGRRAGG